MRERPFTHLLYPPLPQAPRSGWFVSILIVFLAALAASVPPTLAQSGERRPSRLQSGPVDLSHATQAWGLNTGSSNTVVAVLDSGVDYTHQDLAANIWSASNAFSAMDRNGNLVQCTAGSHGLNAISGTCDPQDDNGHGSHVSGILGAVGNNSMGVTGVNWHVQLLPCKFMDDSGVGDLASAIACLNLVKQLKDSGVGIVATNNS